MRVTSHQTFKLIVMKIQVVLSLGSCSNAQVLIEGDRYMTSMTGNAYFTPPAIVEVITACKTAITNLRAAINAAPSNSKTDNIRIARDVLDRSLTMLRGKVEDVANAPSVPDTKRIEIVHSAGMDVKDQVHVQRRRFTVSNTEVSGTVHLTAQGGAKAHEWQYTPDIINFEGRIAVPTTTTGITDIANLKKGTEYAFFHKAIVANGNIGWEGPIICMAV